MKLANRIFLFFGALSVISFVQFNAMGASDCAIAPKAGKYCQKPNNKPDCPKGCWCEGQAKYHLEGRVSETRVQEICRNKNATVAELQHLYKAKVFVCGIDYNSIPYGEQEPHGFEGTGITGTTVLKSYSDPKAENSSKCKANRAQESSGSGWLYDGNAKKGCPPGCFCSGSNVRVDLDYAKVQDACLHLSSNKINGFDIKAYLKERGVNYCPQGYTYASIGAENINQCENSAHQNYVAPSGLSEFTKPVNGSGLTVVSSGNGTAYHCDPGQYLSNSTGSQLFNGTGSITSSFNKFGTTCTDCPAGWYCPGDDEKHQCTGKWKYSTGGASVCSTCPVGRKANSTNTGCEPATVNMESTDVVAQRVEASDLVALEATCLNGQLHKVSFLGGVNATGTMNPVYKCTGDTVKLPSSGFSRDDYQFDKWNCNHNIGAMAAGAEFPMPNADVNCTAQWTDSGSSYTVTYDCNGGTGLQVDPHSPYTSGYNVTVLANNSCTAPSGKTFDKWSCNGTSVTPGNQFTITENTTCKAQWKDDIDQTRCPAGGEYWNGNECADCPMGAYCPVNDDEKHVCENNTYTNTIGNAVCTACPVGETAINNHTDCTSNQTVTCGEGKYLPAGRSTCVQCPDGYGCSGGTFEIKNFDQGRGQCMPDRVSCQNHSACCYCPDGSNPNDTYSGCVNSNGTVVLPEDPDDPETPVSCTTAGSYWNGAGCITCESGYFCPGNGQHYKCPFGGASTQTKASCVLNLNETQMEYNKCWLRYWNNAAAYRKCLYGIDLATLPH